MGWTDNRDLWTRKGIELAEKAVAWAPDEPGGYQMLGILKKALRLIPNKTVALSLAIAEAQLVAVQYGDAI